MLLIMNFDVRRAPFHPLNAAKPFAGWAPPGPAGSSHRTPDPAIWPRGTRT
jgi:hypothetical protein